MDQDPRPTGPEVAAPSGAAPQRERTPEEIQADIDSTRKELGDMVAAAARKADLKAQTRAKVDEIKSTVEAKKDEMMGKAKDAVPETASDGAAQIRTKAEANPLPFVAGGALLLGFLMGRAMGGRR